MQLHPGLAIVRITVITAYVAWLVFVWPSKLYFCGTSQLYSPP